MSELITYKKTWLKVDRDYLGLVPRPTSDQYRSLKNSISEDGQQVPIICNQDGIILDGHTRFQACQELKIKPKFVIKEFKDKDKEKEFVVTSNLARRHLNLFQRAEICFNFYEKERSTRYQRVGMNTWKTRRGEKEKNDPSDHSSRLLTRFGKMIGTGASTAHLIVWLLDNADEKTKELLRTDKTTVRQAYKKLRNPNWKPASAWGDYLVHSKCLNCGEKTVSAKETDCHVHTQICCTKCGWGN